MRPGFQYKNRFYLLLGGIFFLIIISFNLAFSKTIAERRLLKESMDQLASIEEAPLQLQLLESKINEFDKLSSMSIYNPEDYQVRLLEIVSIASQNDGVKIVEMPGIKMEVTDDFIVKTQILVFQGTFNKLIRFLDRLSKDQSIGNICSVDFYNQKDNKTGLTHLKMKVYFQFLTYKKQQ